MSTLVRAPGYLAPDGVKSVLSFVAVVRDAAGNAAVLTRLAL